MKTNCDHCGQPLEKERSDDKAVWCQQCVHDDNALLNSLGLMDQVGYPLVFEPGYGELALGMPENVSKMLAIPKKNVPPTPTPAVVKVVEAPPVASIPQEKIDFDRYNSVLPGRRGSHS